jgi:hypothetical protein
MAAGEASPAPASAGAFFMRGWFHALPALAALSRSEITDLIGYIETLR